MDQVRFGVIGVGGMGQGHCDNMKKIGEIRLAAVCDCDAVTAEKVGKQHGVPHFTDSSALLDSGLCDAVLIATPHPERPPIAIAAMKAGRHVLCEKPLSERVSTADKIIATARRTGVAFGVMFQRRTEPMWIKAMEIVRSCRLVTLYRRTLISPEYRTQTYYDSGAWRATWTGEGGGVMLNQSPHILDLFIQIGGMPQTVYGHTQTSMHRIEVEELAMALLTYADGGVGQFYCSTTEAGPDQVMEIYGDKGKLIYREKRLRFFQFETPVSEFTKTCPKMWAAPACTEQPLEIPAGESGHSVITRNFARHILFGEKLIAPGEDGLQSLELANAVWLSADRKAPVRLPLSRKGYDEFLARKRRASKLQKKGGTRRVTDPQHQR